jgi:uncharacterized lipoprotein YehR (DUF1307 family)
MIKVYVFRNYFRNKIKYKEIKSKTENQFDELFKDVNNNYKQIIETCTTSKTTHFEPQR